MKFSSIALLAASASSAAATTFGTLSNPFSKIPGYPLGNGICLTDAQSSFLVSAFVGALANSNRAATNATLQVLLTDNFAEQSDSINSLAGYPLGSVSFPSKAVYLANLLAAPPTPTFNIIQIVHDCKNVVFRWLINGLGSGVDEVKGINQLVANPLTGQISYDYLELNSVAWGTDTGGVYTPAPASY